MRVDKEEEAPVSADENKALVRRFFKAQAKGDLNAMKEMMAPDYVDHSLAPGQEPGREGYVRTVVEDHTMFSNLRYLIEDQTAEGDPDTQLRSAKGR